MKIREHTKNGISKRELMEQEIEDFAAQGSEEAKKEIAKKEYAAAATDADKLNAIAKRLNLI